MKKYISSVFDGESPCDKCEFAKRCKTEELACRAFSYYVWHGTFHEHTYRNPTKKMFDKIFKEDDKALKTYMKSLSAIEGAIRGKKV